MSESPNVKGLKRAAEYSSVPLDVVRSAIATGSLRAKWSRGIDPETGKGRGTLLFRKADLDAMFDGLEDA